MMTFENVRSMLNPPDVIINKPAKMSGAKLKEMIQRRKNIINMLKVGEVSSVDISKAMGGAYETTQRDVKELEAQGLVRTYNTYKVVGYSDKCWRRSSLSKIVVLT